MRSTSLSKAKAHLSRLVDDAEHRGQRILILRHGKPAAAIVPASTQVPRPARMTHEQAAALLDRLASEGPTESIDEALGRTRADRIC
jgi:prevent-host-death family protein